ncbi:MAG: hypothetical protein V8R75_07850 [Oscillospiraceae bacterium]
MVFGLGSEWGGILVSFPAPDFPLKSNIFWKQMTITYRFWILGNSHFLNHAFQIEIGGIAAIRNEPYRASSAAYPLGHFLPKGRVWGGSPTSILHGRWPAKMASVLPHLHCLPLYVCVSTHAQLAITRSSQKGHKNEDMFIHTPAMTSLVHSIKRFVAGDALSMEGKAIPNLRQ